MYYGLTLQRKKWKKLMVATNPYNKSVRCVSSHYKKSPLYHIQINLTIFRLFLQSSRDDYSSFIMCTRVTLSIFTRINIFACKIISQ